VARRLLLRHGMMTLAAMLISSAFVPGSAVLVRRVDEGERSWLSDECRIVAPRRAKGALQRVLSSRPACADAARALEAAGGLYAGGAPVLLVFKLSEREVRVRERQPSHPRRASRYGPPPRIREEVLERYEPATARTRPASGRLP
jgi:hypothetical protein